MKKAEYLNIIEKNVRDEAKNFIKMAIILSATNANEVTTFTVDTVSGFYSGDSIYFKDSVLTFSGLILSVDINNNTISISDTLPKYDSTEIGTQIKKNDAEQYLDNAILTYSKFRPRQTRQVYTTVTDASKLDLPTAWEDGFSSIDKIRFPLSASSISYLDDRVYTVDLDETGSMKILLLGITLTGNPMVMFSIKHSFDSETYVSTVPDSDAYAVCDIASAYYMLALASRFAQSTNMDSLGADVVNYDQKPNQYILLYNNYLNKAAMQLNIDVDQLKKGGAIDEGYSCNQEIDETETDDNVLIHTNYLTN